MANPFVLGFFNPPINYGIQSPAVGRGGPGMPANSYALHTNSWPPRWAATMLSDFRYPYGAASSKRTVPQNPNLWTGFSFPVNATKQGTNTLTF
jgi:hypothetical protein